MHKEKNIYQDVVINDFLIRMVRVYLFQRTNYYYNNLIIQYKTRMVKPKQCRKSNVVTYGKTLLVYTINEQKDMDKHYITSKIQNKIKKEQARDISLHIKIIT